MLEKGIQKSIMEYLGWQKDIYFFKAGTGGIKTESGKFFRTGKVGCPDILVCKNGQFIGLEVKTKSGKQSPAQKIAEAEIRKAGGQYYIVRSIDDVINSLKDLNNK